jgi:hypothetical protein
MRYIYKPAGYRYQQVQIFEADYHQHCDGNKKTVGTGLPSAIFSTLTLL